MNYVEKNRLKKLRDFLHRLPKEKFKFSAVVDGIDIPRKTLGCGSTACAIGWCPVVFPKLAKYRQDNPFSRRGIRVTVKGMATGSTINSWEEAGEKLFGIDRKEASLLFTPGVYADDQREYIGLDRLGDEPTPKQVAKNITKFIRIKEKQ
jgi:hypothetical protein